jgi:hypothetical protein
VTPQHIRRLFDENIRLDGLWLIPTPSAPEGLTEAFEGDEVKDLPPEIQTIVEHWEEGELEHLFDGDSANGRDAWEHIGGMLPMFIFAKVSTPVLNYGAEGSASYSWGHTHYKVVGAADMDTLMERVFEWVERCDEADRNRSAEKRAKATA